MIDYYEFINILQKASTSDNIIEAIKKKLQAKYKYQDVYEEWEKDNYFNIDHIFTLQNGAYTQKITLLFQAVLMDDVKRVINLLDNGANPSVSCDYCGGNTDPLYIAMQLNKQDMIKLLLNAKNLEVDKKDANGDTVLHWAAKNGHTDIVLTLIDKRANVNAENKSKNTPLHLAAQSGHVNIAALLIANEADSFLRNALDLTPIKYATNQKVIQFLEKMKEKQPEKDTNLNSTDSSAESYYEEDVLEDNDYSRRPSTGFLSKHKGKIGIGVGIGVVASIVVGAVLGFTTTISLPVLAIIGIALVSGFMAGGIACGVAYVMSRPNAEQHDKGAGNMQGT